MKMMNCAVEQPGLDGDLGRPSHRTRKERNLSDSGKSEEKDRLISSLISRLMVTKDDNKWKCFIKPDRNYKAGISVLVRPSSAIRKERRAPPPTSPLKGETPESEREIKSGYEEENPPLCRGENRRC